MQTKLCRGCNKIKPLTDFGKWAIKKDGLQSRCRVCVNKYNEKYRKKPSARIAHSAARAARRRITRAYKWNALCNSSCVDCGETNPVILEFDHIDPTTKTKGVGEFTESGTLEALKSEMAKCEVRCINCHRLKTARDYKYHKEFVDWDDPVVSEKYSKPWLLNPKVLV